MSFLFLLAEVNILYFHYIMEMRRQKSVHSKHVRHNIIHLVPDASVKHAIRHLLCARQNWKADTRGTTKLLRYRFRDLFIRSATRIFRNAPRQIRPRTTTPLPSVLPHTSDLPHIHISYQTPWAVTLHVRMY